MLSPSPGQITTTSETCPVATSTGLDPVWAETHKERVAGERTTTLDTLEPIATERVADVKHLNALLDARPPR